MTTFHQLFTPGNIIYGRGSFDRIGPEARAFGVKALIVSDLIMEKLGHVRQCAEYLKEHSMTYVIYTGVNTEPTDLHVKEALSICRREQCDVIIAVGGGSCIDTAKAVAVLMNNDGNLNEYVGNKKRFSRKPIPLIAVPTTAGTGSEVTKVTVIIDTAADVKMMLSHEELLPAVAIVDPLLTVSCPPQVTAATGLDALCHAIEAYISRRAHPVTDMYASAAIKLIMNNLKRAYLQGDDLEAREQVALGSMLAGAAFSNASVTLVHGMSRPIGALFHVPHGVSNAMLLPAVMEFTKEHAHDRLVSIAEMLKPDTGDLSDSGLRDWLISEIMALCRDLNIPNMKTWGIDRQKFEQAVSKMAKDALDSGSPANNPRVPTQEEIIELYYVCYDYGGERGIQA